MKLVIKGDDNKIKRLAKELKIRVGRDKLEMSFIDIKKQEESKPPVKKEPKQTIDKQKK